MNLKKAVIAVMDRDTLKAAVDTLGLHGVDRRSVADMAAGVSRAHRATPAFLLDLLDERQVKAVCERLGLPPPAAAGPLCPGCWTIRIPPSRRRTGPRDIDPASAGHVRREGSHRE